MRLGGAIGGKFTDVGVDDKFIKEVGDTIEPGHSALFLLVVSATEDKVIEELAGTGGHSSANLTLNMSKKPNCATSLAPTKLKAKKQLSIVND